MKERLSEEVIAMRAAKELQDGDCVNLGTGIPLLCASSPLEDRDIFFEAEHGILGYGPILHVDEWEKVDFDFVDAGWRYVTARPGMCFFDMDVSFDMIRGGRLDVTILGGFQVSEKGDLANWTTGGVESVAIGGSMDLAVGAKRVIVTMTHTTREGMPKILKHCTYPLTAKECVDLIVTDLAVIEVTPEGLLLKEVAPGWTAEEVQALTEPELIIAPDLKEIDLI